MLPERGCHFEMFHATVFCCHVSCHQTFTEWGWWCPKHAKHWELGPTRLPFLMHHEELHILTLFTTILLFCDLFRSNSIDWMPVSWGPRLQIISYSADHVEKWLHCSLIITRCMKPTPMALLGCVLCLCDKIILLNFQFPTYFLTPLEDSATFETAFQSKVAQIHFVSISAKGITF